MVAAGVEGGSKARIKADWSLLDVKLLREHWAEVGPPVYIAVAAYLGLGTPREKSEEIDDFAQFLKSSGFG